jgi:hypothetical protein
MKLLILSLYSFLGLSSAPHAHKAEIAEKAEVQQTLEGYFKSIGRKDTTLVKSYLSPSIQKIWGEKTIQTLASDKPLPKEEQEAVFGDWLKKEDTVFVQLKSKNTSKESLKSPWYILRKDATSSRWLIVDITREVDPRSDMQ